MTAQFAALLILSAVNGVVIVTVVWLVLEVRRLKRALGMTAEHHQPEETP